MTDTLSARERIVEVLTDVADDMSDYIHGVDYDGEGGRLFDGPDHAAYTDRIISIVREALTTDEALVALCTTREYVKYSGEGNGWREGMAAALDAAFGEEKSNED